MVNGWKYFLLMIGACGFSSCILDHPEYQVPTDFAIIFKTGFEPHEAMGYPSDSHDEITFENTVAPPGTGHFTIPRPATTSLSYEGGAITDRFGRIINDPSLENNHILHFWLKNAVIPASNEPHTKGRIQHNFSWENPPDNEYIIELYAKQKIRLHPDFQLLSDYDASDDWWLEPMIHELWMEGGGKSSRIGMYIAPTAPDTFRLVAVLSYKNTGTSTWKSDWESLGTVALPIDEWFTLEIGWRMGGPDSGRFIVTIQQENETAPQTAIDVTDWTYNPESRYPIPLSKWNPQKLYASDNIVHFIRDRGGVLQLYFDDFEFADSFPSNWE